MKQRPWRSTYQTFGIPAEIELPPYRSVTAMMEAAMQRYAERPAFRSYGQTLSYAQVDRWSRAFAAWLQHQGVGRGDRIAVMTPNVLAFPVVTLAILRTGAAQVNVNPQYTARELGHQLNDAGCEGIVVFDGATRALAEIIDTTRLRCVVTAGLALETDDAAPGAAVDARLRDAIPIAQALDEGLNLPYNPVPLYPEDLLFLQYTGGTTGRPKGAALSHRNLLANVAQLSALMPGALRPGQEVVVTAMPLFHIYALMVNFISYFAVGAENWLVADPHDMDGLIEILAQARPTVFTGGNTLYAGLTLHPRAREVDWSRLRLAAGGGAAIMPTVSARWQAITGQFIREGYGLSETSPVLSFNPAAVTEFTATTGLPVPSSDVRLLDEFGREAVSGESGEICVKGPHVMAGYWNSPDANALAFTADGYFRTGDVGVFDARGFLKIVDRKTDMILVSGMNVYPNEVEAVASALSGVAECACVGVPDEMAGESVKLFAVKAAGAALNADDVVAHCRLQLAEYKVPKAVAFIDALPKSAVGKILRRELRKAG